MSMAKTYKFRITLYPSSTDNGFNSIALGSKTYHNDLFEGTFNEALAKREEISKAETRGHAAFLSMQFRGDRVPPGFNTRNDELYGGDRSVKLL
jgi:hypothetical protein